MEVALEKGLYVVAVSGGVDSVVLLDLLSKKAEVELVVAHFDHGIRSDSKKDEKLVKKLARNYGLLFEFERTRLGNPTSEDKARQMRYAFLESVRRKYGAKAIVTAHHQDDHIETAVLNILRGSGRRGLNSISNNPGVKRPLLKIPKAELIKYAKDNKLEWREDSTNLNEKYLRNRVRKNIKPNLKSKRHEMLSILEKMATASDETDVLLEKMSHLVMNNSAIDRSSFISLPIEIQTELMANWLRELEVNQFDKPLLRRLVLAIKVAPAGTKHSIRKKFYLVVEKSKAHFTREV